jgi:hypothetical protein
MRNDSENNCRENKTPILYLNIFLGNIVLCEMKWKNMLQQDRSRMTIYYGTEKI